MTPKQQFLALIDNRVTYTFAVIMVLVAGYQFYNNKIDDEQLMARIAEAGAIAGLRRGVATESKRIKQVVVFKSDEAQDAAAKK